MNRNDPAPEEDPLEELHRVREQIWREAGGTWEGLFEYIKRREAEGRKEGRVYIEPLPSRQVPKDEVA